MKKLLGSILVLLACASPSAAEMIDRSFSERFEVTPGTRLELRHGDGRVEITPWDQDAIAVDVRYRVEFRRIGVGSDPDLEVEFDQRDRLVRVIGHERSSGGIGFFSTHEIEYVYRVRAPRYVELELTGEDGDIEIEGWRASIEVSLDDGDVRLSDVRGGEIRIDAEDGDVELRDIEADIDIDIDDGDVEIEGCRSRRLRIDSEDGRVDIDRCSGNISISADDGDIRLTRLSAASVDLSSSDGSIELDITSATGPLDVDVRTDDGDVEISLGRGVSTRFDLESDEGRVTVDAPATGLTQERQRASGTLGDGGGKVRASSGGGRILLRQAG